MTSLGTVAAVKALVYDAVFKRAQEIAASEKLRSVVFDGEFALKGTAECIAGKSAKSGLCKHAVALLLRRVREVQKPETIPPGSPPEEQVISISSQIDDIATNQDARKSAGGREAIQSTRVQGTVPPASGSKRALPAWMLGVVGSAAGQTQPSNKPKSNKRAAEPKPPRPAPPPTKRARRPGQPFKISNDSADEEENPGEVHDAGPMEKCPAPVVSEDDQGPDTIDPPTEGAAARERRRLRALKKEVVAVADDEGNTEVKKTRGRSSKAVIKKISDDKGNEEFKGTRGRSSKAVTKEVSDQPLRAAKRRRLSKKYVEEDSDRSENEAAPVDADVSDGFGLTDEDLLFLAQEQLEKEKATGQAEDLGPKAPAEPVEEEKLAVNSSQGKKLSSSIFSMNKWKEMSSQGKGSGGALRSAPADLDWETLKNYSREAGSQSMSQIDRPFLYPPDTSDGELPSLQTAEAAPELKDVPIPMPLATGSDDVDAVTNDMLSIFFGSSQVSGKKVITASSLPSASHEMPNYCAAEVGLEAPTTSSFVSESVNVVPTLPAIRTDLADLDLEPKVKKKSSLKDRVKMLLR